MTPEQERLDNEILEWKKARLDPDNVSASGIELIAKFEATAKILMEAGLVTEEDYNRIYLTVLCDKLQSIRMSIMTAKQEERSRPVIYGPDGHGRLQ